MSPQAAATEEIQQSRRGGNGSIGHAGAVASCAACTKENRAQLNPMGKHTQRGKHEGAAIDADVARRDGRQGVLARSHSGILTLWKQSATPTVEK